MPTTPVKYGGKDFLIQRQKTITPTWETIAAMRSTKMTVNNEAVDVTTKGDVPWKALLPVGIRSMEMDASGCFTNDVSHNDMMADAMAGSIVTFQLISGRGDIFAGPFLVQSVERHGEYNKEEQYTLKLSSAGAITFTPGA